MTIDPYSILGVSNAANGEEIKAAYRRVARRLHPDANRNNPGAVVQFQDITAAYDLLMDPDRKHHYDRDTAKDTRNALRFIMSITPSKRAIRPLEEPQVMYLLADITPDPRAAQQHQQREARLNLTLVLDRSNSMNGTRLERVKVAAHQIIDQLSSEDILSVIAFSDRAEVVISATTVQDKPALKARISLMTAAGGTEIYQGLRAGLEQTERFLA